MKAPLPILTILAVATLLAIQDPKPATELPFSPTPLASGLSYSDPLTVRAPKDFLRGWPATDAAGLVHAVIENPAGVCDKWEVKLDGVMRWDLEDGKPRWVKYLGYPANYGIVPRAVLGKEIGGDGDPLDILVLGPSLPRGSVVAVELIGTIRLVDGGEQDDKLIGVVPGSPLAVCSSLAELDTSFPGATAILRLWFENYKGAGMLQCSGFGEVEEARRVLLASSKSFEDSERLSRKPGDERREQKVPERRGGSGR